MNPYHYDAPPHDIHKPTETQQLEREGVDYGYIVLGVATYVSLVLLTLAFLP